MQNALYSLALFAAEQLLRAAPTLFLDLQKALTSKNVTADELRARRDAIEGQTYEQLVPHSEIPAESETPQAPV